MSNMQSRKDIECADDEVRVFLTSQNTGERLSQKESLTFVNDDPERENLLINVYEDVTYQQIEGFGGAFTEAGAVTYQKLSTPNREKIMQAYFSPEEGIGYTLCRTHINSCDFSMGNYDYIQDGDKELTSFDMKRDKEGLFPFIKDAMKVKGSSFKLFASPWSPPAFMKTNGQMNRGGSLKPEFREVWAKYFCKYIKEAKKEGLNIWGISLQNEAKAVQPWDSCVYTADEERDFVGEYLGLALERDGLSDIKIILWDHNKERVYERSKVYYSDPKAEKYIWGVGFHWYSGDHFENLEITHKMFPDKKLLFTEGCQEGGVKLGSWAVGERYAHDIIGNLNNWAVGFVDWNILLDEMGGPNHVGNYCDAPIIGDTVKDEIYFQSSYYYLGHFSKFIRPGAVRIGLSKYTDKLEATAFKNIDNTVVVVVLNRTDSEMEFYLRNDKGCARQKSLPHSIMTLLYHI